MNIKRAILWSLVIVGLLGVVLWIWGGKEVSAPVVGRLSHEVYVWQRVWGEKVGSAVGRCRDGERPVVEGVCVLVGEVRWRGELVEMVRPNVDWAVLKKGQGRVSLAWRIPLFHGKVAWDDRVDELLRSEVAQVLGVAREAGVEVSELQVDFDCPTRLLGEYAGRMRRLKREFEKVKWVVTVLPAWLEEKGMGDLAEAVDGLVLQVHWLHRARDGSGEGRLVDEASAQRAVRRCAELRVPFRVALPTYGNGVVVDESGAWVDVLAEEGGTIAKEARVMEVRSEPGMMVRLVEGWEKERVAFMTGIFWYRLPVEGELRNWQWETFAAVVEGRLPVARFEVVMVRKEEGFDEVVVVNGGDGDGVMPRRIFVKSDDNDLVGDGANGYDVEETGQGLGWASETPVMLKAGKRFSIGWVRRGSDGQASAPLVFQMEP